MGERVGLDDITVSRLRFLYIVYLYVNAGHYRAAKKQMNEKKEINEKHELLKAQ